jgi:hypothetical protein
MHNKIFFANVHRLFVFKPVQLLGGIATTPKKKPEAQKKQNLFPQN